MSARKVTDIPPSRKAEIQSLAEELAEEFRNENSWTDVNYIAEELGITRSYNDYGSSFDGMLECENGRFHIYANIGESQKSEDNPRVRFTVAHELGHYALAGHRNALLAGVAPHQSLCDQPKPLSFVEAEADHFASRLLMPTQSFEEELERRGNSLHDVIRIASVFKTSIQSTAKRIVDTSDEPVAVVFWKPDQSFHWTAISKKLRSIGFKYIRDKTGSIALGSASFLAMNNSEQSEFQVFRTQSVAYQWFDSRQNRDMLIEEEALKTSYYTMTWLTLSSEYVDGRSLA